MSVSLKIEDISKYYGKTVALNHIHLEVKEGEFVCLLGPSGCGKTTLLRLIAGLDQPDMGQIHIGGRNATKLSAAERNFGIVFQSYALFPNLTAFENVAYGLRNRKISRSSITEIVDDLFEMIHLQAAKYSYPNQLSGGEQQRVALARALAIRPDFLLLDEPLSALDAKVRQKLRREICAMQKKLGLTTIMVTHDQDEALTMADRIVVMNKANIMQVGTPIEIYQSPQSEFVADFIGEINFISPKNKSVKQNTLKNIGAIRPEKIELYTSPKEDTIHSCIEDIEFRGSHYRIVARAQHVLDNTAFMVDIPFLQAQQEQLTTEQHVYLRIPNAQMLHFDRQ